MRELPPTAVLEVRFLEPDPAAESTSFDYQGARVSLGPPHLFGLAEVGLSMDSLERPAVHFRVQPRHREAFLALTEANVGRPMAVVVDGTVVTMPLINAPLPGTAQIEGEFDLVDVESMILAMSAAAE